MATENRRQALLREMGIQCWFPRAALPGAGTSHDICPVSQAHDQPPPPGLPHKPTVAQPEAGARMSAELRAVLTPDSEEMPLVSTVVEDAGAGVSSAGAFVTGPAVDSEPAPEFAFSWFSLDKRLSVLAMLPAGADRLNSSCGQMLKRILAALSSEFRELRMQEHTFHWPFPDDLGLPTGQSAARQAVDGFVARRLREQPSSMLLILADDTPPFLYGDRAGSGEDDSGSLCVHRQFGFAMLRTNSLHAMDANSGLKRSAWQAMQPLRDRLGRGDQ